MDAKIKHLEFIQTTINRMAHNSFLLKGWAMTVVGGVIAISFKEKMVHYPAVAMTLVAFFWALDVYYLFIEKRYRDLYDEVRAKKEDVIDFSMHTNHHASCRNLHKAICSEANAIFYGALFLVSGWVLYLTLN